MGPGAIRAIKVDLEENHPPEIQGWSISAVAWPGSGPRNALP